MFRTSNAVAQADVSTFGTFHNIGITADVSSDSNRSAIVVPRYRPTGSDQAFKTGMPLSRVSDTRFSGSLFWLQPGVTYDIQLQFSDPDSGSLDGLNRVTTATTRANLSSPKPKRRLYVSANAADTNCSRKNPCSLTMAVGLATAGDEVLLETGRYFIGGLRTQRSGTVDAPIVIRAANNARVVLDGAYPTHFKWVSLGNGLYSTTVKQAGAHLVVADGRRLFAYRSLDDLTSLHWGLSGIFAEANTLYLKLKNGEDPNEHYIAVSRFNDAFIVDHDHYRFEDLEFTHYGHGDYALAIYFRGGSNNVVQRNRFVNNDVDIALKYAAGANVIQDNVFIDTVDHWPWDAVKKARGDPSIEAGAVMMYGPVTGRGNVIRRNTFQGQFDAIRPCPPQSGSATTETDVYENTISRIADDAIEADGDCSNVRIYRNQISDVLVGVSMSPAKIGPTYIIRNLIYRTGYGNNQFHGTSFKFNNGDANYTGPVYLFHNTIDSVLKNSHGLDLKSPGNWLGIVSRNNIYRGSNYAIRNVNLSHPVDFDYDNFTTTSKRRFAYWGSTDYRSLRALRRATNTFIHAVSVTPEFRDALSGDYTLSQSSVLIDAGIVLPGINDEYSGRAPDIGAFELR